MNVATKVSEAVVKILAMEKGTVIHHTVLAEMAGERWGTNKYYSFINNLMGKLKDNGVFLENENRIGYRIAASGEEIDTCNNGFQRGVKKMTNSVKDMAYIRVGDIKDEQKRQRTIQIAQSRANLIGMLKLGGAKETATLTQGG